MVRRGCWHLGALGAGLFAIGLTPGCAGRAQSSGGAGESAAGSAAGGAGPGTIGGTGATGSSSAGASGFAGTPGAAGTSPTGTVSDAGTATDAAAADAGMSPSDYAQRCAAALNGGQAEHSCELSCSATNDCCGGGGYCGTNGWTYYAPVCVAMPVTTTCSVPGPTASIAGMSPLGPLTLQYAWAAEVTGFSYSMQLFFTASPVARRCETTSLGFLISVDNPTTGYPGQHDVDALLAVNGAYAYGAASVQILSKGASGTRGTLTITSPGWDVSGEFTVPDCPALDSFDDGK